MLTQISRRVVPALRLQSCKFSQVLSDPPKPNFIKKAIDNILVPSNMPSIPLTLPFPGVHAPDHTNPIPSTPTQVTTLENGLRVVSIDTHNPVSSVGVFVNSGSRYEDDSNAGISYLFEQLAFKSSVKTDSRTLIRESSRRAVNILSAATRDHTMFVGDSVRDHLPYVVNSLYEITFEPALMPWEIKDVADRFALLHKADSTPDIVDAIHSTAYNGNNLGRAVTPTHDSLYRLDVAALEKFRNTYFTPNRMVLAGVGVDHSTLVSLAKSTFGAAQRGEEIAPAPARYYGGESRHQTADQMLTYAIAFEAAHWHSPLVVPLMLLQVLLGGGSSFSAGGPGKGMYSRVYQNQLNAKEWLASMSSFAAVYNDSSLFGMYGSAHGENGRELAGSIAEELRRTAGRITSQEFKRAKNQLKSSVLMNLENRSVLLDDMARQLITYGQIRSPAEICSLVDKVTEADVQKVASEFLSKPPTVVSIGNTRNVPRYDEIIQLFK